MKLLHLILGSLALAVLLAGLLLFAGATGAETPRFLILELFVPGQVRGVYPMDMDEDSLEDLAVVHNDEKARERRYISLFYYRKRTGYRHRPDLTIPVPDEVCAFFLGNYHPSRGKEIGWLESAMISCTAFQGRKGDSVQLELVPEKTFFVVPDRGTLPYWDPFIDIDKNGLPDMVVPKPWGYLILFQGPRGRFPRRASIPLKVYHSFGHFIESRFMNRLFSFNSFMPRVVFGDYTGDGLQDVMAFQDRGVAVFSQGKGGAFPDKPDVHLPLKLLEGKPMEGEDAFRNIRIQMADIDGDGRSDMIVSKVMGRIGFFESVMTQQLLFLNGPRGINAKLPNQIINLRGVSIFPRLIDVDGDGSRDLVVSSLRTDLMENVKRAIFKSVKMTYYMFLFGKDRRFSRRPDYALDLELDIDRIEMRGTIPFAHFNGDYTGDGLCDLLSLEEENRLKIVPSTIKRGWFVKEGFAYDEDRSVVLRLETSNQLKIMDLNHDRRADIIFFYREEGRSRGKLSVVLSR